MRRVTFALLALMLALSILACGCESRTEPPGVEWLKTFGGPDHDWANCVQQTSDGGYIIAGITNSYGAGSGDFWVIKTDGNGDEQWRRTFGGPNADWAWATQQTSDGGYIVAGRTSSYGAGDGDFWLIKIDDSGNEQWNKTFGGPEFDAAVSVQQTSDHGYIIVGKTHSYGAGNSDFCFIKTDSNGEEQWKKVFGDTEHEAPNYVIQTSDGGYLAVGVTRSYGVGESDIWVVKTDSEGNKRLGQTFGTQDAEVAFGVQQTSDGGYILVGKTEPFDEEGTDALLIKLDAMFHQEWSKTFGGANYDVAWSVQQTADGEYITAGMSRSYNAEDGDFWIVKTDEFGEEKWSKTIGGPELDEAWSIQQTTDGGYIVAGNTRSPQSKGEMDFWLIKLEPEH